MACSLQFVDGVLVQSCEPPASDAVCGRRRRMSAANDSSVDAMDITTELMQTMSKFVQTINTKLQLDKKRGRKLAHASAQGSGVGMATVCAAAGLLVMILGCTMPCAFGSDAAVEARYHKNRRPHPCLYIGCPCFAMLGSLIYVLFIVLSLMTALNSVGGQGGGGGLTSSSGTATLTPTTPPPPCHVPKPGWSTGPDPIVFPRHNGQCCTVGPRQRVGNHNPPTWHDNRFRPLNPMSCAANPTATLATCRVNGRPCPSEVPQAGLSVFMSDGALAVRARAHRRRAVATARLSRLSHAARFACALRLSGLCQSVHGRGGAVNLPTRGRVSTCATVNVPAVHGRCTVCQPAFGTY